VQPIDIQSCTIKDQIGYIYACRSNANLDHCKVQARYGGEGGLKRGGVGYDEVPTKEYEVIKTFLYH